MKTRIYISDVKKELVSTWGLSRKGANKAIKVYGLRERINRCPMIALHDDPRSIAETIANDYSTP